MHNQRDDSGESAVAMRIAKIVATTARRNVLLMLVVLGLAASAHAQAPSDTVEYYHLDALGSVRAVTDQSGAVVRTQDYRPFGEGENPAAGTDPTRFTAKERDAESGLDYFGARYYASRTGRFTTVDPVLNVEPALFNPQRWNRYAYAGNNPLRFKDPDGADFWDFVNGVSDAMRANFALGVGRSTGGNGDFVVGQRLGDMISLAGSAIETVVGTGAISGGTAACGTGVGCLAGAPAISGGAVLTTHAVGMGIAASVSLMQGISPGGNGSSLEVTPTTNKSQFEPVRGTSARRNPETGEIWVKDRLHKDHYEVYKNKKDFENGVRDRAVWEDGRLKERF